ncbi:hypothetical protein C2G38_2110987 [Gigaspora rosea]|nr:hypothetical protein C2G38_2110987 [Gigaspora rosea]
MTEKIAMMRMNKNDIPTSISQYEDSQEPTSVVQPYGNELSAMSNISQQTTTTDLSNNSVATTNMTTLKIRHRPNKNLAKTISQPYNRTRQNKQIVKDNEPIISRVPSMDEEQFQVTEEIQPQNLDFTQVNRYASFSNSSTSSFEEDIFDYVSTHAPTTSFSNLSDISDFSQLSDVIEFDQLNDISTVNNYSTLSFGFEQYDSSSTVEQSSNGHDFTHNTVTNISDSYLDCTSNTNNFVSTNTSQNFSSEQASIVDVTNQSNLFDLLLDNDTNITQQTYFDNSNFAIDSLDENIDSNNVES